MDAAQNTDVLIVGAGPAGTAAAIELRRRGLNVMIVDKATFPRDKCCGDGLTTNALRRLEDLGFSPLDSASRIPDWQECRDVIIRSPQGREIELQLPSDGVFAAIAPRMQLDHALVQLAQSHGAVIHQGCAFRRIVSHTDEAISVEVDGVGTVTATWVIAADGMWSPVRRALGVATDGYLGEWHAFRQYFSNVTGPASTQLYVWFDDDLLPGYAWSFPLPGNRVNFGFGILRTNDSSVQYMKRIWKDLPSRPHIARALGPDAVPEDRHTAWPIPARIDSAVRHAGRVLFVGDAVCATDVMTGEGIGQALETGLAAAQAIAAGGSAHIVRQHYSREIDRTLLADHRMSMALGRALARPRLAEAALRLVDLTPWTRRNFVRWMFEDEGRAAAFTPRRWHKGFLQRAGAFHSHGSS